MTGMKFVPLLIFGQSAWPLCRCETFEDGQPDVVDAILRETASALGLTSSLCRRN